MMAKRDETDESGYSEKKIDQNTELQAGQWLDLNQGAPKKAQPPKDPHKPRNKQDKNKKQTTGKRDTSTNTRSQQRVDKKQDRPLQQQHASGKRDEKILSAINTVSFELEAKIDLYLQQIVSSIDEAETALKEISELQAVQKSLLQALKWEAKGDLDVSKLSKQVQNLLK